MASSVYFVDDGGNPMRATFQTTTAGKQARDQCLTATRAAHAPAPLASQARTIIVFVPVNTGIPAASQWAIPVAVPVAPAEVCQVTWVIPAPPAAMPAIEIVAVFTVTTTEAGDVMAMDAGALTPLVLPGGGARVIDAVCVAL